DDVHPSSDRDLVRFGIRGTNADRIACLPEDPTDVLRAVREEIPRVRVLPLPNSVDDAASVRMDQPSEKARRLLGDDRRLPGCQLDLAQMLRPRTVLGEHARPMPPVGVHLDTPDMLHGSNTIEFAVANGSHRTPDLFDRVRIAGVHHPKLVGTR